jgi:integrase
MATIRKRGPYQWQAIIKRKGYPLQSKTFDYQKDAEAWARDVERGMDRGSFMPAREAERTTVHELIDRYTQDILPEKRGKHFGPALRQLDDAFGKYALATVSSRMVAEFRDKRIKAGKSASTVRKEINLLSRLIDLAGKEWGVPLSANPCAMVSRPAERNSRNRRLEPGEAARLIAEAESNVGYLVLLALETSARLGELLSVNWSDVDLEDRVMVIRGMEHASGRRTKNNDASRAVPLSTTATAGLKDLIKLQAKTSIGHGQAPKVGKQAEERVFSWWKASDSFNKTWVRVCERAGVENLRFHDLRHEATSRLFELGVFDSMEVASITGHKTLAMLKRYTHLKAKDLARKLG